MFDKQKDRLGLFLGTVVSFMTDMKRPQIEWFVQTFFCLNFFKKNFQLENSINDIFSYYARTSQVIVRNKSQIWYSID